MSSPTLSGVRRPLAAWDERRTVLGSAAALALLVAGAAVAREDFEWLLFGVVAVVCLVALRAPLVGALAAVVLSPTFSWVTVGPDLSPFQLLVAAGAVGAVVHHRRRLVAVARHLLALRALQLGLALVAWMGVSLLANRADSDVSFVRTYAGSVVLLGLLVLVLVRPSTRALTAGLLVLATTCTAVVGLVQVFTMDALVGAWVLPSLRPFQESYTRMVSPWGLASVGSEYGKDVLVGFLLVLPFAFHRALDRRVLAAARVAAALLGIALLVSGSRSSWLGGLLAVLVLMAMLRRPRAVAVLAVVGIALAVCLARPATPGQVQDALGLRATTTYVPAPEADRSVPAPAPTAAAGERSASSLDMSTNLRRRLTRAGLDMVRDRPLTGVGPGAFPRVVDRYEPLPALSSSDVDARPNLPAHNVYLEVLADTGVPGAALYLGFLAAIGLVLVRWLTRAHGSERTLALGVAASLIGLLVTSAFHNYQFDNLLWILCALPLSHAFSARGGLDAAG